MEEEEPKQGDGEQNWTKHTVVKEFINIGSTIEVPIASLSGNQPRYYVNMPKILIVINHASIIESENMVENLAQPSLDENIKF
jgi:sRNA-binding carbon storage regulator CsrA